VTELVSNAAIEYVIAYETAHEAPAFSFPRRNSHANDRTIMLIANARYSALCG
jgi:hypothetical protein